MIRRIVRSIGLLFANVIGSEIRDYKSGQVLGKAFIFAWRGQIHVIGLKTMAVPAFRPQERLTYWKQEIVFTRHPKPDFPREKEGLRDR